MSNIKWKDGAVCFAGDYQMKIIDGEILRFMVGEWVHYSIGASIKDPIDYRNFQLNEIRTGDYIEASELDTEQKYNDAVEVFGLFGHLKSSGLIYDYVIDLGGAIIDDATTIFAETPTYPAIERKITYPQLMAIGKLKRAMIEREKSTPKIAPDLAPDVEFKSDWSDEHYNHFYQLTEEDIKAGQIKVDAYFVNRMWKINSWEDTGAGFHILKTLPRIANNKNSLKRELVALKKQVDILCKLHGVDDE